MRRTPWSQQQQPAPPISNLSAARPRHPIAATTLSCTRDSANPTPPETVTHILSHLPAPAPGTAAAAAAPSSSEQAGEEDKSATTSAQQQPPVAYINRANEFGNTALHWACLGGHLETVQLLLSRGASPALANAKDQIPLDMAAFNNHMAVVNYFLSQSKDLEGDNAADGGLDGAVKDVEVVEEAEEAK